MKFYNNKEKPHCLNFPFVYLGRIYEGKYVIKIGNYVLEFGELAR